MLCRHANPTLEAHCVCQHQQLHASRCNTTRNLYAAYHHPVAHQAIAPTLPAYAAYYAAYIQKAAHQEAAHNGSQAILRNISSVESTRLSTALHQAALPSNRSTRLIQHSGRFKKSATHALMPACGDQPPQLVLMHLCMYSIVPPGLQPQDSALTGRESRWCCSKHAYAFMCWCGDKQALLCHAKRQNMRSIA